MQSTPLLEIKNVSKRFGGTQALKNVGLELYPGEVHTLLGENGAGKSTLIKIMTGVHQPDNGEILLEGNPISIHNTAQAQAYGIAAIYQEPLVFPDLNVAENIFISHRNRGSLMQWGKLYRDAEDILAKLGVSLDVYSQARGLNLAAQQTVEIAKAISLNVRVLIMDEPTASLSLHEVQQLFKLVQNLRDHGVAILFISHRMDEVFEISDRITVFRDGQLISSNLRKDVTPEKAIQEMVGREMESLFEKTSTSIGNDLLVVKNLRKDGVFSDVSFTIRQGEILGFAGLVGAGRTDIALSLFGIAPADGGEITLDGQAVQIRSPQQAIRMGIAYVPEDRRQHGLVLPMSIAANISLPVIKKFLNGLGFVQRGAEYELANRYKEQLNIRTPSVNLIVSKLSGGNQQKVVISKWLNTEPRLLILDEPTRGIDVGAKAEVHRLIHELAKQGIAIMLISSDLPEVLGMSDRVLVMREGKQMGIFDRAAATQEVVMTAAMGQG